MEWNSFGLCQLLNIKYPIVLAPMFLVSNEDMVVEALNFGVAAAIPSLNFRTEESMRSTIRSIRKRSEGPLGINLIVNKSNVKLDRHLQVCLEEKVDFIITSLGSPKKVIDACKPLGIKVFCDVVDAHFAKKVENLGADAIIAVNSNAGGHAGPTSPDKLIPELKEACSIPVISAGGVSNNQELKHILSLSADGLSIGSVFIASDEAGVSQEYKEAIVNYGSKDIVMTTKLSGTPCTVINTPYVQQIGTNQNWFEGILNKNKRLKKFMKALTFYRGMKKLQKAAFSATYQSVWCAGPSIENVKSIRPVQKILAELVGSSN